MHIKTDELPDLMDSLTITLSNSLLFVKLIILWFNDRAFEDILIMVIEDYDNNEETNDRERMNNKVILSKRFASCTIILYSTTVILFSISVIFAPERVPVLKMEFPFDAMRSPIYELVSILQFIQELIFASTSGLLNGLIVTLSFDSDQGTVILAKTLPYYTVVNLEAFVLCFAGEYLTSKGKAIGEAAYTCTWYELRPNESRYFLLLILRSQKRLTITIGKFMDLSLECFASILKASASYVSVLYAMY
ncbi:odorant receptor 63a-like isoform X2 [Vespula maculifrons]|uniref:Odorant receptor 63a-like isoform X2 n=2 Tax=Vespula TaxID=7451 RepID=A0ABD2BGF0_VESMC